MKKLYLLITVTLAVLLAPGCKSLLSKKELTPAEKAKQKTLAATLPFDVTIGGQAAQMNNEFCAKIAEPVDDNAEISVGINSKNTIVLTVTPGTKEGLVQHGKKPEVLTITNNQKTALDKTYSGKKIKPGLYILNANADNKVASIIFEIKKPSKK